MYYEVIIKKQVLKNLAKMPLPIQKKLIALVANLKETGAIRQDWPNFSKLSKNEYHCHLSRKWVACWRYEKKSIIIEVYYVGSRENAPY